MEKSITFWTLPLRAILGSATARKAQGTRGKGFEVGRLDGLELGFLEDRIFEDAGSGDCEAKMPELGT